MNTTARLAWLAMLVFACALVALGAQLPGYSQLLHPVAFAGARGLPGAWLFNAMVFVLPGALLALVALRLRAQLPGAGLPAGIGASLLLLSALAFAAQGLLPLDPADLDAGSRHHATAWTVWWIAYVAGGAVLAACEKRWRVPLLLSLVVVLATGPLAGWWLPAGLSQRIAFAAWFAGFGWIASRDVSRGAA